MPPARRARLWVVPLLCLLSGAYAPWDVPTSERRLILDVTFETSKDYDITSAYAVRGWNTTEGSMAIRVPSVAARHGGGYGMEVKVERAFTQNFHAQFSLPHFMPRVPHSLYQLTFWARMVGPPDAMPEVSFMDVDEGYDWVGGANIILSDQWQHIAMEAVATLPKHQMHEIQIAFMVGKVPATYYFDDIQLYELDVFSPPPPSPPPPPNVLLWLDAEGGPKGAQVVVSEGKSGKMISDLSSKDAAHEGTYGFELEVQQVFEQDWYAMLSLPAFLVTDHLRTYTLTFWAKSSANPKPRPHIAFQDEDNNYAYISGDYITLSAIWHQYTVNLVVPKELRAHNVIVNIMVGSFAGTYYFDEFEISNADYVMPPPYPPSPPPSPPPGVMLTYGAEDYARGLINSQAWPEGKMTVLPQSELANHDGSYGLLIEVSRPFEHDWHAQVSFKPFTPPDTNHGYVLSFWARATPQGSQEAGSPKVVFHDADDAFVPLKQVVVPMTADWNLYQVDLAIAPYRQGHSVVVSFWVGEFAGSYMIDDLQVSITSMFSPPPPSPPGVHVEAMPPPSPAPGVLQLLLFEESDEDVTPEVLANNGSWSVSIPDPRAAHTGSKGLYALVDKPWGVASLAQLLLPRYVQRADRETLLHLSFYAKVEKLRALDPPPTVTVAFVDLNQAGDPIATEEISITSTWQLHYVVIDLKREHVGHQIRPYLYLGKHAGIFAFDDFEYKEIPIEDGMAWLQRAPERIQAHRMRRFELLFLDRDDWPIDYGTVDVRLARHDFELGVSLETRLESRLSPIDYQWLLSVASKHFWAGTLASQLQWSTYEPAQNDIDASFAASEELIRWTEDQGWLPMVASLFDGGQSDQNHWTNQLACHELETHLHTRISRDLTAFKGRIGRYELWRDTMKSREWIDRCGEELLINAWKWAKEVDATATLCSLESDILTPLTLTRAEAYHNTLWGLSSKGVPLGAIGVQAHFQGEVDASTVKHRLDVLRELRKPIYITDLTISGLEPGQHAYEFEKMLRLAFSHDAVAGITIGGLWDGALSGADVAAGRGPGLFTLDQQPKPALLRMDGLWGEEWNTAVSHGMTVDGTVAVDGFYGVYTYELRNGDQVCKGEFELSKNLSAPRDGRYMKPERITLRCDWHLSWHYPIWGTPAIISLISVGCLFACYRKRSDLIRKSDDARFSKGYASTRGARGQRVRMVDTEMEDVPF